MVALNTDEDARRLDFPGSPTIRLNGENLFPDRTAGRPARRGLGCRLYATPEGLKGSPTKEMIRAAISSDSGERLGVAVRARPRGCGGVPRGVP